MNGRPVLLDVNVPMYAAGRAHPYREACVWAMTEITEGRLAAAIDTETIQEVLHRFGALRQWSIGVTMAESLLSIVPTIYPVLPADIRLAVELFARHGPRGAAARDLLHVAVMQNNGLTEVLSVDRHFDGVDGISRVDPITLCQNSGS